MLELGNLCAELDATHTCRIWRFRNMAASLHPRPAYCTGRSEAWWVCLWGGGYWYRQPLYADYFGQSVCVRGQRKLLFRERRHAGRRVRWYEWCVRELQTSVAGRIVVDGRRGGRVRWVRGYSLPAVLMVNKKRSNTHYLRRAMQYVRRSRVRCTKCSQDCPSLPRAEKARRGRVPPRQVQHVKLLARIDFTCSTRLHLW